MDNPDWRTRTPLHKELVEVVKEADLINAHSVAVSLEMINKFIHLANFVLNVTETKPYGVSTNPHLNTKTYLMREYELRDQAEDLEDLILGGRL